ncbi:hypothetical protein GCM10029964_122800 [Kibdelosporangium lantanae]
MCSTNCGVLAGLVSPGADRVSTTGWITCGAEVSAEAVPIDISHAAAVPATAPPRTTPARTRMRRTRAALAVRAVSTVEFLSAGDSAATLADGPGAAHARREDSPIV